jgi:hypothetical protein
MGRHPQTFTEGAIRESAKFLFYWDRGVFAKHAPTICPGIKLNLAIEEHFTPGAASLAHHNPNNDCLW